MSDAKMTASLSIDPKYVEGEVQRIVKAAIVAALGNRDEIIRGAIDNTIGTWVDKRTGEPAKKDSYYTEPYLDYLAKKTVESVVREVFEEVVNENRDEFKAEIKRQIGKRKWKENLAEAFVALILEEAKTDWEMPVSVTFEKPKDY